MDKYAGSRPASTRRPCGRARVPRNSTENGVAADLTLPPQMQNDSSRIASTSSNTFSTPSGRQTSWHSEIPPPEYDELFAPACSTVSRRPAKTHPSAPEGMDPLVAAMWHNENLSLLHSLPDHLLLKIIQMLSDSGVECIRRVARKFTPLCVREVLSPLRGGNARLSETGPMNWPRFRTTSYLRPQFLELIDRDQYCDGCHAARKSSRWEQRLRRLTEYIHCSACRADHPACLFSATQRLKPARLRYCIAHEGYMRICDHDAGIVRLPDLLNLEPQPRRLKDCAFTVLGCTDPSHDKLCKKVSGGSFPKPKRDCGSRRGVCNEHWGPWVVGCETSPHIFDLRWAAHLPFNGHMDELRLQIAKIQDSAGRYIVPRPASATHESELRCFDPNDCHCITFSGTEKVRWEWECGPWIPGTTKCISDPFKGLNALLPPRPSGSTISKIIRNLKSRKARECPADLKFHQSRLEPSPPTCGPGRCAVDVRPCHTSKDCLLVNYMRAVRVHDNGKITSEWYNTLDPASYNVTADEDGLGVFWCPEPRCRNYHKNLPNYAGILRRREFRKECRHNDCQ